MEQKMFCFQCEQTAGCAACTGNAGVCGKPADVANLQDELTGALIGLALAAEGRKPSESADRAMLSGLFTTITNVNFSSDAVAEMTDRVRAEAAKFKGGCAGCAMNCGAGDLDMAEIWRADEDIRSLKALILFGLRGMAAYAYHAMVLGYTDEAVNAFFYEGLRAVARENTMDALLPLVLKTGEVNFKCM
jgi:hydroxylamine reductase